MRDEATLAEEKAYYHDQLVSSRAFDQEFLSSTANRKGRANPGATLARFRCRWILLHQTLPVEDWH